VSYRTTLRGRSHAFGGLRELLAKASPHRSGDALAGLAAESYAERVAAQTVLADVPLTAFLEDLVIPYESDDVTRLIVDTHDAAAFAPIRHLTVGGLRVHLLCCDPSDLTPGLTPEMVAAVSKLMRNQDLVAVARRCQVTSAFRTTVGLPGRMSTRLQPNHPTDDPAGVLAATVDGLLHGCGDAVIGINPATDAPAAAARLLHLLDDLRQRLEIPTQSCVLSHVTTTIGLIERGAPFDLVFQSIAGTQAANEAFGITLDMLGEAREAAVALERGTVGRDVMYFETGQGSALSAGAHHGVDQQTVEVRAYAVARAFSPFLVNTVVGFIGPEYLYGAGCRGLPLRHHRAGGRRRHVGVPEPVLPRRPLRPRRTGAPAGARVRGVARPDRPARRAWSRARRLAARFPVHELVTGAPR